MAMSRATRGLADRRGFTLIEGAVSIVLLSITVIGMYNTIVLARRFVVDARRVTEATNFARKKLEEIADTDFLDIMELYPPDQEFDAYYETYLPNATWSVQYFDSNGQPLSSTSDPLTIRLTVSWRESSDSRERSVQLSTRVTEGRM